MQIRNPFGLKHVRCFKFLKYIFCRVGFSFTTATNASIRFLGGSETKDRKKESSGRKEENKGTKKGDQSENEDILNF